ncbi:MAG TPA: NAD(P)/FAD-dependent oxidoreductase [Candidatus Limnocylindria bacterium]|nr:NAD(P)/FAD-dependent oxidoreductase [Candidatus Limnocylindria bacterium]
MPRRVAIIGAGVAGLVAGRELARRGHHVTLYDRWPDVAGQASAFDLGNGVWIDRYYHHLFQSDSEMIALHDELLPGELEWHTSSVGIWSRGRVWPFVSPLDLLRYRPLAFVDRLRLGYAVLRLTARDDWERMDDIGALEWLRKASGDRALASVWTPLMLGKFGDDSERIPLAWLWSKFRLRRKLRGSGATKEQLGYPRGSFRAICQALASEIRKLGGEIHVDREVLQVREDAGFVLRCAGPGAYRRRAGESPAEAALDGRADAVLFTTPTFITRRLADWPSDYARRLDDWTYETAVVLLLELRRPYSPTYWTNIADSNVPFLGLVEHTNLVPADRYPARYLYVSNYVAGGDPLTRMNTEDLLRHYVSALGQMNPRFDEHDVLRYWSFREEAAQPVPRIGNRHRILPFASPRKGLYLANTTQIYPEDRGTNYSARIGREVAERIAADG